MHFCISLPFHPFNLEKNYLYEQPVQQCVFLNFQNEYWTSKKNIIKQLKINYFLYRVLLAIPRWFSRFFCVYKRLSYLPESSPELWWLLNPKLKPSIPTRNSWSQAQNKKEGCCQVIESQPKKKKSHLLSWTLELKPCCLKSQNSCSRPPTKSGMSYAQDLPFPIVQLTERSWSSKEGT